MTRIPTHPVLLVLFLFVFLAVPAQAAPALRVQVVQHGDFVLLGNALAQECAPGTPAPVVGTVGACGAYVPDSAADVFWRADEPSLGSASADIGILGAQARSTAMLNLPAGATVTHAFLYWSATLPAPGVDTQVTLDRPGVFISSVVAVSSFMSANNSYLGVSDVTNVVQANGGGAYRVSGVDMQDLANLNNNNPFGAWWMVVLYAQPTAPLRNLAIFDGLDAVSNGNNQSALLTGFLVPPAGWSARLGVVSLEGDPALTGDQLFFNGGAALTDAQNPVTNFFNGTHSSLGLAVSQVGDLPQLTGTSGSVTGLDLDVVDVTAKLSAGMTSATIQASSTGDVFYLAAFVTAVDALQPLFQSSSKTAVDLNGGALLPGDVVSYTITATNTGNETSVETVVSDPLPPGAEFVPGSIMVTSGPNVGPKTDADGDDQCSYVPVEHSITCRLGVGADAAVGGGLAQGGSSSIVFQMKVPADTLGGVLDNQASISAAGLSGSPAVSTPSDADPILLGAQVTHLMVDQCDGDGMCASPTPLCDLGRSPKVCVQCLLDEQCPGTAPLCDQGARFCVCVPSGNETCNARDDDCNGLVDEGFDIGSTCSVGLGACLASGHLQCAAPDATACDAIPGNPAAEVCGDQLDTDCDGALDNGCPDTDGDSLIDALELAGGTSPTDADSDDDGVMDDQELDVFLDPDMDSFINGMDPDSDNDGLFDGTEMGLACDNPATNLAAGHCIPDADLGATTTLPLDADTDQGGRKDGDEDLNHNGALDALEWNPNLKADDQVACFSDVGCGNATSGLVCVNAMCVPGCGLVGGNGCPAGKVCSSPVGTLGMCVDLPDAGTPDAAVGVDAAQPGDAGVAGDAAVSMDASEGPADSSIPTDAATPGDASAPVADASTPDAADASTVAQLDAGAVQEADAATEAGPGPASPGCACDGAGQRPAVGDALLGLMVLALATRRKQPRMDQTRTSASTHQG